MTSRHPVDTLSRDCVHTYTETETRNGYVNENRNGDGKRDTQGKRGSEELSTLGVQRPAPKQPFSRKAAPVVLRLDQDRPPQSIAVDKRLGETDAEWRARVSMSPATMLSAIHSSFAQPTAGGAVDATLSAAILAERVAAVNAGDLSDLTGMLLGQAQALQTVAQELLRRAGSHLDAGPLQVVEAYARLALKAQAQSRATLETLAEMKNPRPVFINGKQVNVSNGNQQVNNTDGPQQVNNVPTPSREGVNTLSKNELLEAE